MRRRWEERKDRSSAVWEETGSAAKDEMLAGAVGCGDEEDDASPAPVSAGVEAEPASGVTVGGAAAPGKNGKNGAGGGGGSAGVLSRGNSGSCSALLPQ